VKEEVPEIPIPLRVGDPDALLDLGLALRQIYDRGGYDLLADYRAPIDPPLAEEDRAWARGLLQQAGLA
jgi:hypothetical protein